MFLAGSGLSCSLQAWLRCGMGDLHSPSRDQTRVPPLKALDHQEKSWKDHDCVGLGCSDAEHPQERPVFRAGAAALVKLKTPHPWNILSPPHESVVIGLRPWVT